ncbi:MAG TPA: N-6 DNA methylase [Chloroflexia bacterium]|nr:N-6 DNA methylase [Chloroflexia bacterium]
MGLLPIPLFSDRSVSHLDEPRVLLNGSSGNFVLDLNDYASNDDPRNFAWSSNVGHYVTIKPATIEVQRWDQRRSSLERYSLKSVLDNLEGFHAYLEKQTPRSEASIVAQTIRIFRDLRTILGSTETGADSLQAFLYLLACATDGVDREKLDITRWRLSASAKSVAMHISEGHWETLVKEIRRGRPSEYLVPDLRLLLRHAAGQLFQEAHYEAIFVPQPQLMLEGFFPTPVQLRKDPRKSSVHFTPPFLVRTLVEAALKAGTSNDITPLTVFDPACGSGEFLREVLRQLKLWGVQRPVHIIGWDISEAACAMANFVLSIEQRDMPEATIDIQCLDALAGQEWPQQVDMVVMNPPFVSWQDMEPYQKENVQKILGPLTKKLPDLSHAFVLKAVTCLRMGGVFSSVLPAAFLTSESAQKLRANLVDQLTPRLIARLGSQMLFPGALVDAACYVAIKSNESLHTDTETPTVAFWAGPGRSSTTTGLRMLRKLQYWGNPSAYPVEGEGFSIYIHPSLGRANIEQEKSTWTPPPYKSWKLIQNSSALPRVSDLFDVRQGVQTGYNRAFLLTHNQWVGLPKEERKYFRPAVVNEAIHDGKLYTVSYIFFPYGEYEIETEDELLEAVPQYYEAYLLPSMEKLRNRARMDPNLWWTLKHPRDWENAPKLNLVSTHFGNAGSFALDTTGEFVVVQGLSWRPKKVGSRAPQRNVYLAYLSVLNSSLFNDLLAATSRQVSGGQWELTKQYVDPIPLPDFFVKHFSIGLISELASLGEQGRIVQPLYDARILELLAPLYRLSV